MKTVARESIWRNGHIFRNLTFPKKITSPGTFFSANFRPHFFVFFQPIVASWSFFKFFIFIFSKMADRPPFWNEVEIEKSGLYSLFALVGSIYMWSFIKIGWKLWPVNQFEKVSTTTRTTRTRRRRWVETRHRLPGVKSLSYSPKVSKWIKYWSPFY